MRKGSNYRWMALALVLALGGLWGVAQAEEEGVPPAPEPTLAPSPVAPLPPAGSPACAPCTVPIGVSPGCCVPDCCPPTACVLPEYPLPWLYARTGFLALRRDANEHITFATLGSTGEGVLSTADVESPFKAGGEITVGLAIAPTYYVEFDYFGLGTWSRSAAVRDGSISTTYGSGDLMSPFGGFGATPNPDFDYNNYAAVTYRSQLDNYEINLRHQLPMPTIPMRSSFLFGGRAMRIDDSLLYETESVSHDPDITRDISNSILSRTHNRLVGLQVGGLFEFHCDPGWWVNLDLKGGICQNRIHQYSDYVTTGGSEPGLYQFSRAEDQTSFVGEVGLSLLYEFGPSVTADVGYRAIWVTGLALGADNLQTDPGMLMDGPLTLNADRTAVFHGPHAGLTVRF